MKTPKIRVFNGLLMLGMCLGMLTGCGHTHEWIDADCTHPKTCATCDKTEGEALGHQLSEATYQTPAQCNICGETEGDVLVPDFVTYGIETDLHAVGDITDYITISGKNTDIIGKTTLTSYNIYPSFKEIEERDGYECRVAVFDTEFGNDALTSGVSSLFYVTDYYNTKLFAENPDHSNAIYSVTNVNINGENQPVYVSQTGEYKAQSNKLNFRLTICVQVPVGYDGIVCGLVHSNACGSMDNISEHYSPEDFVLFRMGK